MDSFTVLHNQQVESNGTVLSIDWKDVGTKKIESTLHDDLIHGVLKYGFFVCGERSTQWSVSLMIHLLLQTTIVPNGFVGTATSVRAKFFVLNEKRTIREIIDSTLYCSTDVKDLATPIDIDALKDYVIFRRRKIFSWIGNPERRLCQLVDGSDLLSSGYEQKGLIRILPSPPVTIGYIFMVSKKQLFLFIPDILFPYIPFFFVPLDSRMDTSQTLSVLLATNNMYPTKQSNHG
ncbi:hypothetical protein YC2023_023983 [Brassica napus]